MKELEFSFHPVFDFVNCALGGIALMRDGKALHEWHFAIRYGSTFHSWMLIPFMERVQQMYMSTTRGLLPPKT